MCNVWERLWYWRWLGVSRDALCGCKKDGNASETILYYTTLSRGQLYSPFVPLPQGYHEFITRRWFPLVMLSLLIYYRCTSPTCDYSFFFFYYVIWICCSLYWRVLMLCVWWLRGGGWWWCIFFVIVLNVMVIPFSTFPDTASSFLYFYLVLLYSYPPLILVFSSLFIFLSERGRGRGGAFFLFYHTFAPIVNTFMVTCSYR